jgi:hypothetical protein
MLMILRDGIPEAGKAPWPSRSTARTARSKAPIYWRSPAQVVSGRPY